MKDRMAKPLAAAALAAATADLIVLLNDDVTQEQADTWMAAVIAFDPYLMNLGVDVRDALRDNCPHLDLSKY